MSKKTWSLVLKAPALLLLIASFLAGIYAAIYNIQDMGWEVPIILGVVIFLYFIGSNIERKFYEELKNRSPESKPKPEPEPKEPESELEEPEPDEDLEEEEF